jgi:hypothetical protein
MAWGACAVRDRIAAKFNVPLQERSVGKLPKKLNSACRCAPCPRNAALREVPGIIWEGLGVVGQPLSSARSAHPRTETCPLGGANLPVELLAQEPPRAM